MEINNKKQLLQLNQTIVEKQLLLKFSQKDDDIVCKNVFLLFNYRLFYLNFVDICQKNDITQLEIYIIYLIIMYQGRFAKNYSTELLYLIAYLKKKCEIKTLDIIQYQQTKVELELT